MSQNEPRVSSTAPPPTEHFVQGDDSLRVTVTRKVIALLPGVGGCLAGAIIALTAAQFLSGVSPLLLAILMGAVWRNFWRVPRTLAPGITWSSKKLLRTGIMLLGFQLSLSSILDLGFGVLGVVIGSVVITFFATLLVGQWLSIGLAQRLLVASGFSICGAAAVAATEGTIKSKEEEVATAIGLVVLFGTLMIPLVPFLGNLLGMPEDTLGMWIGASTHEVAQVVAAGGAVGSSALAVAVTVKLARVITLAPMIAGISIFMRRKEHKAEAKKPAIVPLFVLGFVFAMLIRTSGMLPPEVLSITQNTQTILLAAAMFALGLGVHLPSLLKVGPKPLILGLVSTTIILLASLGGTLLFSPL